MWSFLAKFAARSCRGFFTLGDGCWLPNQNNYQSRKCSGQKDFVPWVPRKAHKIFDPWPPGRETPWSPEGSPAEKIYVYVPFSFLRKGLSVRVVCSDYFSSRKCAIHNFWTNNLVERLGWGARGSRQIIYVRLCPNIWSVFGTANRPNINNAPGRRQA